MTVIKDKHNEHLVYVLKSGNEGLWEFDRSKYEDCDFIYMDQSANGHACIVGSNIRNGADVILPSNIGIFTVTGIGEDAFEDSLLNSVTIPNSVIHIEYNPFIGCENLKAFIVSRNHPCLQTVDGVLFDKSGETLIAYPGGRGDKHYTVPDGTRIIGRGAFCRAQVETVSLPEGLQVLEEEAFANTTMLTGLELPQSVCAVGAGILHCSEVLTQVSIPAGATELSDSLFAYCRVLKDIRIDPANPVFELRDGVLFDRLTGTLLSYPAKREGDHYDIPEGTRCIAKGAFTHCLDLRTVAIPDSVIEIGENNFTNWRIVEYYFHTEEEADQMHFDAPELIVGKASFAESYALDNDFPFRHRDAA